MPSDNGATRGRSGGMSVSLASPDGRVVGGGVAGLLVAASPVQVWSFFVSSTQSVIHYRYGQIVFTLQTKAMETKISLITVFAKIGCSREFSIRKST